MKKFITAVALVATMAAPAAFAFQHAGSGARAGALGAGVRMGKILGHLNLTADQKAQIKSIVETSKQQNQALFQDFRAKVAAYRQLKQANDPGADAAKAALKPLADQVKAARKATRDQVLAVLTPDQIAKLKQLRAQGRAYARGFAAGHHQAIFSQLNLTADQKAQIKAIREQNKASNQALFQDFHAKMKEFRQLKQANDPKADAVKAELKALRPQIKAARQAQRDAILAVLTPEQRAQLEQLRAQHGSKQ